MKTALLLALLTLPGIALAQPAPAEPQLQVGDYASGLAAMVDEAHVREVHLHAELAAAQKRLAAASQQIAQLQAIAAAAAPAPAAAPAAAEPPTPPATH